MKSLWTSTQESEVYFGRAFELVPDPGQPPGTGRIVLPCEFCGNPVFVPEVHMCPGLYAALVEEAEQRERDQWRES